MEEVARQAGVTKPILYDHFPSKEALYLALLDEDAAALERKVRQALSAPTGNRQRIADSFVAYFDFVDEHAEGFKLMMQEALSPLFISSSVNGVRERIHREVAVLIARESEGRLSETDAATVSIGLIAIVEAGAQRTPGGPRDERMRQVDLLVQLAWRGMTGLEP